jgi:biotin carboxylase
LEGVIAERGEKGFVFPLIVKPCTGWNSDCVVKVRDLEELRAAVRRASARHADSAAKNTGVVIEPYVDGPEVDANFVVLDGEVLFCDVTDDFPCSGDLVEGKAANFMETLMDVPSALPQNEQAMMVESLRQSIKRCGFASGIFHCEARVRNSNAYYKPREDNGILDLHVRSESVTKSPSCYLHEVNARPPGYINCVAALLAYGVDYYAIRLLLALGPSENERIKALAQPFLGGKPQYTLGIAVLPPTREGIMGSEDAVGEFLEANPDLQEHVVFHQTVKERGEVVQGPDSSELWCVGYVIVASPEGRKACLELAQSVRERFDYKLLDE